MKDPSFEAILPRFFEGALFTGLGKLSVVALGIVSLAISTRVVPPGDLGLLVVLMAIVGLLGGLSSFGVDVAASKFLPGMQDQDDRLRFISTAIWFRLLMVVVTGGIAALAAPALFGLFGSAASLSLVVYLPVLLALESTYKSFTSILQGLFKFTRVGTAEVITSVTHLIAVAILVLGFRQGVLGLIYAKIISRVIALGYTVLATPASLKYGLNLAMLKKSLAFGLPLQLNYIMSFLFHRMDIFLIGILLGTTEVAFYDMARKIPDALTDLYGAFLGVYLPFTSELADTGQQRKLTAVVSATARYTAFGAAWGALITFAFGRRIISLLFSDAYLPSVPVFWVLMIALVFLLIDSALGYTLVAIGETNKPPISNLVRTVVSFASYFLFIPMFGTAGAALAGLVGLAAVNPLNVLFLHRKKVNIRVMAYLKPILLLGLFLLPLLSTRLSDILRAVLVLVVFPVINVLLSVITAHDVAAISGAAQLTARRIKSRLRPSHGDVV